MKFSIFIGLVLVVLTTQAQYPEFYDHDAYLEFERFAADKNKRLHTSIKPYDRSTLIDTGWTSSYDTLSPEFLSGLYRSNIGKHDGSSWTVLPMIEALGGVGASYQGTQFYNPVETGFKFLGSPGERWSLSGGISAMSVDGLPYRDSMISGTDVIHGFGYAYQGQERPSGWNWEGRVKYNANKFFDLELGKGKHFFGDGYRSLLLSDNAVNYPYFRIDTRVWHIRYINLYSMQYDIRGADGDPSQYRWKYSTAHYLDWSISKSVNLAFFESIVWQAKDTLLNRQFDVNYLNPVIFYRPVEYSLGSSDNSIMGLNLLVKITDKHQVYGQFIIDEFLLEQVKGDVRHFFRPNDSTFNWGWWANKYGYQIGYKAFDLAGVKGLNIQTELNFLRPYTFTHGSVKQNYGHFNQPLAHPLGANFVEHVNVIRYDWNVNRIRVQLNWAMYGTDSSWTSYGGNIFKPYTARPGNYFHETGQGLKNNSVFMDLSYERLLNPNMQLRFKAGVRWRHIDNSIQPVDNWLIYCGIRTDLWNRYEDY